MALKLTTSEGVIFKIRSSYVGSISKFLTIKLPQTDGTLFTREIELSETELDELLFMLRQ